MEAKEHRYDDFVRRLAKACNKHAGVILKPLGDVDEHTLYHVSLNPEGQRKVLIIAGIHGNEPGGSEGVIRWLENLEGKPNAAVEIIPLANPYGYVNNQRRNKHYDMNRQWADVSKLEHENKLIFDSIKNGKYDLLLTLHEDPEQRDGFYLYYSGKENRGVAERAIDTAKKYFPIYKKALVYGNPVDGGMAPHNKLRTSKDDKCLETWLYENKGVNYITTEPSGKEPLVKRAKFMSEFIDTILNNPR